MHHISESLTAANSYDMCCILLLFFMCNNYSTIVLFINFIIVEDYIENICYF